MEKIAIVTGASRGIGKEIAIHLAKNGVKVIANYNKSENQAKELKQELEKINIKIASIIMKKLELIILFNISFVFSFTNFSFFR